MSNSVVSAAAAAQAKQLIRNKKLTKRADDQRPASDEQHANGKDDDKANAIQAKHAEHSTSMSDSALSSEFTFAGALSAAAADSASLAAQDDGGTSGGDSGGSGGSGTLLAIGAVGLVGAGVAVLASGGGSDKNEAPVITSAATATIAENATTVVYQVVATDPDGDGLSYTLGGADAALFNISSTGAVTLKTPANFESGKTSYAFTVIASDGDLSDDQAVVLTVTNVNEAPVITSAATATVAENAEIATAVYQTVAADPDAGTTLTYTLTGADAALFTINATGAVFLKAPADFEDKSSYNFNVVASDGTLSDDQAVVLTVTDVEPEGPGSTTAAITISAVGENTDTLSVATAYTVTTPGGGAANYQYTITDFDSEDTIVGPAGAQISIINDSFTDNKVVVEYFANNQSAQIVLEGLTGQQDASIIDLTTLNGIFGAGSIA